MPNFDVTGCKTFILKLTVSSRHSFTTDDVIIKWTIVKFFEIIATFKIDNMSYRLGPSIHITIHVKCTAVMPVMLNACIHYNSAVMLNAYIHYNFQNDDVIIRESVTDFLRFFVRNWKPTPQTNPVY